MNFLKKFQAEEKAVCIYLSLGVLFFLFFDYSISKFFYNINSQTKSLFETLTHFGDSLYFFVPTIIIWAFIKIIDSSGFTYSDSWVFTCGAKCTGQNPKRQAALTSLLQRGEQSQVSPRPREARGQT